MRLPAFDDLLQLQHLRPYGVKQWEHGAYLLYRFPEAEWAGSEGH
jgi:hypothetical protein